MQSKQPFKAMKIDVDKLENNDHKNLSDKLKYIVMN